MIFISRFTRAYSYLFFVYRSFQQTAAHHLKEQALEIHLLFMKMLATFPITSIKLTLARQVEFLCFLHVSSHWLTLIQESFLILINLQPITREVQVAAWVVEVWAFCALLLVPWMEVGLARVQLLQLKAQLVHSLIQMERNVWVIWIYLR